MSSSPAAPLLDVDLQPGKPPMMRAEAAGDAPSWAAEHRDGLRAVVAEHGSILVRGLGLRDADETGAVFKRLAADLMTEREAFAPRQTYSDGVYSSATWPANQPMCMHHELSYTLEFPSLMLFACLSPPTDGGATAVADSPTVLDALPVELTERFERDGWMLTRNYNDEIGASIAEAFGTDDPDAVASYCRANAIDFEWQPDGGLRTGAAPRRRGAASGHRPAMLVQPDRVPERVDDRTRGARVPGRHVRSRTVCRSTPASAMATRSPRTSSQLINQVYDANTAREPWRAGDLMLVDNIRTAHSREAFEGPREVLVAMADPVRLGDFSPRLEVTAG